MKAIKNLLIINFTMDKNHGALAWQPAVVERMAEHVDHITVLTDDLPKNYVAPQNVETVKFPARPLGIPRRIGGRWAFNYQFFKICKSRNIDAIFIHMAMEWAYILGPTLKFLGLPVVMWYAHGTVSARLKTAAFFCDKIITSTPSGCRLKSDKVTIIGQAINTEHFQIPKDRKLTQVLYTGRISRRKNIDKIIAVANILKDRIPFALYGPIMTQDDMAYDHELRTYLWKNALQNDVTLGGFVPYDFLPTLHHDAFVHLNLSDTGSMDKTVMESLACGCPVLTSNQAFFETLKDYPEMIVHNTRPEAVAEQINHLFEKRYNYDPEKLRKLVTDNHDLSTFADRVLREFETL